MVSSFYHNPHDYPISISEPQGSFRKIAAQDWFQDDTGWYDRYTKGKHPSLIRLPRPPVTQSGPIRVMPQYPEKFREDDLRVKSRGDLMRICRDLGVNIRPEMSKSELINDLLMRGQAK